MEMEEPAEGRAPVDASGACALYETEDGRVVLYDEDNPDAYLRSSLAVEIER